MQRLALAAGLVLASTTMAGADWQGQDPTHSQSRNYYADRGLHQPHARPLPPVQHYDWRHRKYDDRDDKYRRYDWRFDKYDDHDHRRRKKKRWFYFFFR